MEEFINHNGRLILSTEPVITAGNRGFRFGEGLFETMRMKNGKVPLSDLHFERLFSGMESLQFGIPEFFNEEKLITEIVDLAKQNRHSENGRMRLTVYAPDANPVKEEQQLPAYIIQSIWIGDMHRSLNDAGLQIGVFPGGRKSIDAMSAIKTNNYLLYVMAAHFAKKQGWDDCLVLNSRDRVAESTISNLFWIKNGILHTPPLSEGCVAGVMRRWLMAQLPGLGYECIEKEADLTSIKDAEEVFLTNAISGIRWVENFDGILFGNAQVRSIYDKTIRTLW